MRRFASLCSLVTIVSGCEGTIGMAGDPPTEDASARPRQDLTTPAPPDADSSLPDRHVSPDRSTPRSPDASPKQQPPPAADIVCGAFLPSGVMAKPLGYTYRWYYTCVEDRCAACGQKHVLVYGRKGMEAQGDLCKNLGFSHPASWGGYWTTEGAFWCCHCDADYDGVTGWDHLWSPKHRLSIVYGPVPISGPNVKPPGAPK